MSEKKLDVNKNKAHYYYDPWKMGKKPLTTYMEMPPLIAHHEMNPRLPLINVAEDEKKYKISAELPGLSKEEVEMSIINDNEIEIHGEKEKLKYVKELGGFSRKETSSLNYYRRIPIPEDVDPEQIKASMEHGLLKITLPKTLVSKIQTKKVDIE
ncbi:MAG: Hsp20/alpha crystallin family protein [Promethearchaeota archaeon]|nr:MAG: Hsp20/alpha crystallin family protein [Candidatus Lokiarchaeota archaeon]